MSDSSITSSWMSEATWIISTNVAASNVRSPPLRCPAGALSAADSSTVIGRIPLPRAESA